MIYNFIQIKLKEKVLAKNVVFNILNTNFKPINYQWMEQSDRKMI